MNIKYLNSPDGNLNQSGDIILSGIKNFDDSAAKLKPGQLVVVTGKPNMGKTTFIITAMCNMALNDHIPVANV